MSSDAKSKVTAPAICLIVAASISILVLLIGQVMNIFLFASGTINNLPEPNGMSKETQIVVRMIWNLIMIVTSLIILFGAMKMMKLQDRGLAKTACILSLIPCIGPCFIVGIPFGIWGLVVLSQPDVAQAFRR